MAFSGDEPAVGDWDDDGTDSLGVHRGRMWYLDIDSNGSWNVPGDQCFEFGIEGDEPLVGRWQCATASVSQVVFGAVSPALAAEMTTRSMVGQLLTWSELASSGQLEPLPRDQSPTKIARATGSTQVDSVSAADAITLPSALERQSSSAQATRSCRLGSAGAADLLPSTIRAQAMEEVFESIWRLA